MAGTKSDLLRLARDPELMELMAAMEQRTLTTWALTEAELALQIFEEAEPADRRPRAAIEAGWRWVHGEQRMWDARKFAWPCLAAARETSSEAATYAARACSHALAIAHAPGHAGAVPGYLIKAVRARYGNEVAEQCLSRLRMSLKKAAKVSEAEGSFPTATN
jgi:hypothetical protein